MRTDDIKEGCSYTNKDNTLVRTVTLIGMDVRPGTARIPGVEFIEDTEEPFRRRRLYLDTFAQWARKEILT